MGGRAFVPGGVDQFPRETFGLGEMTGRGRLPRLEASRGDDPGEGGAPAIAGERAAAHPADCAAPALDIGARGAAGELQFGAAGGLARTDGRAIEPISDARSSLALRNLRGLAILILLAFHSLLPYLWSARPTALPFDQPPYGWRAFPIVDAQRWFGFDLFSAWQDVYLMALMFFLSGLFAWPSLARKGSRQFLRDRALRLGAPFVFGVAVVMPLALYPAYRVTAVDPNLIDYGRRYLALPFLPNGPMWFLWLLMALTAALAGLRRFAPHSVALLGRLSSDAGARPGRYFIGLATVAALAYVPLAIAFTPWNWSEHGPLTLQLSRPLLYAVYYFAGLGVGAHGLARGLLAPEGMLTRRWRVWLASALAALLLWMGLAGLTLTYATSAPLTLQMAADVSYALAGASSYFFALAACLRFGVVRSRLFDGLSKNALGIYILHYAPLVWLQYALLDVPLFAVAKALIVFGGTLLLAFAATAAMRGVRFASPFIGEAPRALASAPAARRILPHEIRCDAAPE
jgi:fucose 4-O-acetylase-like acetyltransferase